MGRAMSIFFWPSPLGHGEGPKGQISFNFNYKVNFKVFFIPNFVCVLTNERYKTYQTGFSFCCLGHAPGVGWGAQGGKKKNFFFQTWSLANQIDGDDEQNKCK